MTKIPVEAKADTSDTARLVRELRRPGAYPGQVDEVSFLQTHISLLFFAGSRVYKVKKPVDLGFLDFTSLERRRHFCEEEVRLNRRLAPDVYIGIAPITRSADGHLCVRGEGEAIEWAVEMVRLPEHRMLASLLERGELDNEKMNTLAALLADFHRDCATGPGVDEHGAPDALAANVEENFEQLDPFVFHEERAPRAGIGVVSERQLRFLRTRARDALAGRNDLLERRVREQRIREGHGDLHAGNIAFTDDGVVVYDCIEFNRRFRCGDVAADLAFLAMDLDYKGYPSFSRYLVKRYAKATGDGDLESLVDFYKGYRAIVRGKVVSMAAADPAIDPARREALRREAMRYVQLAAAYELPPAMLLMCGLPGTGKSWLARRLARSLRALVLQSDVRRKVLSGIAPTTRVSGPLDAGLYSQELREKTYRSLLERALEVLRSEHSVIVDATFARREYRSTFVDAAARLGLPYYVVHVTAPDGVVRERLARRANDPHTASDAGLEVYERELLAFEPPSEVPPWHVLTAATGTAAPEEQSSRIIDRMIALRDDDPSSRTPSRRNVSSTRIEHGESP